METEAERTQVVVAVGGEAKRMGLKMTKALIKLGSETLLNRCVRGFLDAGFRDFIFLLGYQDTQISEYLDGADFGGAKITKSYDYAQGIAKGKAIKHALMEKKIDSGKRSIMVWPDDIFLARDIQKTALSRHVEASRSLGTLSSAVVAEAYRSPYGIVNVDGKGIVTSFEEKPLVPFKTTTGMYLFEPSAYGYFLKLIDLDKPGPIEFENTVMPALAAERKVYAITIPADSWLAINTQKELEQAQKLVEAGKLPRS